MGKKKEPLYVYKDVNPKTIVFGKRFREELGSLEELKASIEDKGIVQPITVAEAEDGSLQLVAGGRRLTAALELELKKIPVIIRKVEDELDLREVELLENAQRKDLTWVENNALTAHIDDLMRDRYGVMSKGVQSKGWSIRKTALVLNRSAGGVARQLQMHRAVKMFPDLANEPTEDKAVQKLRKLEEAARVQQMSKKYDAATSGAPIDEDDEPLGDETVMRLQAAENHFRIGDAFEGLNEMLEKGLKPPIALIEVDPPYGIDLKEVKKGDANRALDVYEEVEASEYPVFLNTLCQKLYQVAPDGCWMIFWFGPTWITEVRNALTNNGWNIDPIPAIWYKGSGQTNSPDRYLARTYEMFYIAWKGSKPPMIRERGRANVFQYKPVAKGSKYHPTQRPLDLMREILRTFIYPKQLIMVPFLGSGATLRAAYLEGNMGWGWELNDRNKKSFLAAVLEDFEAEGLKIEGSLDEDSEPDKTS